MRMQLYDKTDTRGAAIPVQIPLEECFGLNLDNNAVIGKSYIQHELYQTDILYKFPTGSWNQETLGNILSNKYYYFWGKKSIIDNAISKIETINNTQSNKALEILTYIQSILQIIEKNSITTSLLPSINAFFVEDGSILLEWIFNDFRIGFSCEENIEDSGWYLITNKKFGEISASGYINGDNIKKIVIWLISFIIINIQL